MVLASSNDISAKRDMDMNSWPPLLPELGMRLDVRFLSSDPEDMLSAWVSASHILCVMQVAKIHKEKALKQLSFSS